MKTVQTLAQMMTRFKTKTRAKPFCRSAAGRMV